jgi:hypothetical protein
MANNGQQANFFDWEKPTRDNPGGGGDRQAVTFLKLQAGGTYRVRLIGSPVLYYQHWEPIMCRSPYFKDDGSTDDPLIQLNSNFQPKKRYAIWVIDRDEKDPSKRFKVMDFAPSLYDQFYNWKDKFNDKPGGMRGPDWVIEGKKGKTNRQTKWVGSYLDRVPLTQEEVAYIDGHPLKETIANLRKPDSPDYIRQKMVENSVGPNTPVPQSQQQQRSAAPAAPARQAAAPAPAAPVRQAAPAPEPPPAEDGSGDDIPF